MAGRDVLDRAAQPGPLQLRYGPHSDQVGEAWPGSSRCVVLLHGGFWREAYDRAHLRPLAAALAGEGATVLLPEYRRVGGSGGWPATFDDVRLLLARLPGELGAAEVVLAGHSAGGHLALWAAAAAPPKGLSRVVALAPVADLVAADRLGLDDGAAADLLGGHADDVPDRYRAADPAQLASPTCPVALLHAVDDPLVPWALSSGYAAAHPHARLTTVPDGHFGVIDPDSRAWPAVRAALLG